MFFSVITPAFNAASTIDRVYESLNNQSFRDFEWIVVNDGSTDDIVNKVEQYISVATFPIQLISTTNQHKKSALRHGLSYARGLMTLIADADDEITANALKQMHDCWQGIPNKTDFNGICGLCVDEKGQIIGDLYPESPLDCNAIEMRLVHCVKGEKWGCVLTEEQRETYPDFTDVIGHVPEGIYQRRLTKRKARFVNDVYRIYHTSTVGSLTNSAFNPVNSHGIVLDALDWLDNYNQYFWSAPLFFCRRAAAYNKYKKYLSADVIAKIQPQKKITRILLIITFFARFL